MAKKGGSFWDNPFGGMFDFNRDGREDFGEQWLAFKIFEECTKQNDSSDDDFFCSSRRRSHSYADLGRFSADDSDSGAFDSDDSGSGDLHEWRLFCDDGSDVGIDPEDYDTEEEYEEALADARSMWRFTCEDGSDLGIDPYDYESEDEYEEALAEARSDVHGGITLTINVSIPGMEALNAINPADYPNKRKYEAAYRLRDVQQGTAYISEDSSPEAEIERCQFILNSDTIAARYLTVYNGFLYAQAVKEHFTLPIDIPDEDDSIETYFDDLMREVAEEDPKLAVEIWGWCIKQFGPYPQYMYDKRTLYNFTMCSIDEYPEAFLDIAARAIGADQEFCDGLLTRSPEFPCCSGPLIAKALKIGNPKEASLMFIAAVLNPAGKGKDLEELIERIISDCSDWEELETMEAFQTYILPIIEKMENKRIVRLYPKFAKKVSDYISYVEKSCEQYQYSRRYAWRKNCEDGSKYNIYPLDYETEAEYNQAIYDEKYAWRHWASFDARKYGIDPTAFETEEEFSAVVDKARQLEQQRRREELAQRQQQRIAQYVDPLSQTDKTVYTFCGVMFENSPTIYHYRTNDDTITIGDLVVVPVGRDGKEAIAEVVTVQKHRRATAPYPVDRAKIIKGKYE